MTHPKKTSTKSERTNERAACCAAPCSCDPCTCSPCSCAAGCGCAPTEPATEKR